MKLNKIAVRFGRNEQGRKKIREKRTPEMSMPDLHEIRILYFTIVCRMMMKHELESNGMAKAQNRNGMK